MISCATADVSSTVASTDAEARRRFQCQFLTGDSIRVCVGRGRNYDLGMAVAPPPHTREGFQPLHTGGMGVASEKAGSTAASAGRAGTDWEWHDIGYLFGSY
jgi:hypothetical protein